MFNIIASFIKKYMVPILVGVIILVLLIILSMTELIANHKAFVQLNAAMEEVYIQPYDPNNMLIKNQTLDNMEEEIMEHIKDFDKWYEQNIGLNEEYTQEKQKILNSEKDDYTKLTEVKKVYLKDVTTKNQAKSQDIDVLLAKDIDYNNEEQKVLGQLKKTYQEVNNNGDLKTALDNYETLTQVKNKLDNNINSANKRIKAEQEAKEKAEQEAKEQAEQEAKEQAEQEAEEQAKQETQQQEQATDTGASETSTSSSVSGNFDRGFASAVYSAINAYRSSLGLPAYSYNSSQQSCVDSEATAYASSGNPHTYLCGTPGYGFSENAGYIYDGFYSATDLVNMWKQDEPHHRPLKSTEHTSVTVSAYKSGSYLYVEACFW